MRERVNRFAARHGVPQRDAAEFVTAVAEALANAIEHARTSDTIEVNCWLVGGDQLLATVVDHGVGFPTDDVAGIDLPPDPFAERGRGVPIMRRCVDLFSIRSRPGSGTSVILGRYVDGRRGREEPHALAG